MSDIYTKINYTNRDYGKIPFLIRYTVSQKHLEITLHANRYSTIDIRRMLQTHSLKSAKMQAIQPSVVVSTVCLAHMAKQYYILELQKLRDQVYQ